MDQLEPLLVTCTPLVASGSGPSNEQGHPHCEEASNEQGQPLQDNEQGQPIKDAGTNEQDQPLQDNEQGQPLQDAGTNEQGHSGSVPTDRGDIPANRVPPLIKMEPSSSSSSALPPSPQSSRPFTCKTACELEPSSLPAEQGTTPLEHAPELESPATATPPIGDPAHSGDVTQLSPAMDRFLSQLASSLKHAEPGNWYHRLLLLDHIEEAHKNILNWLEIVDKKIDGEWVYAHVCTFKCCCWRALALASSNCKDLCVMNLVFIVR